MRCCFSSTPGCAFPAAELDPLPPVAATAAVPARPSCADACVCANRLRLASYPGQTVSQDARHRRHLPAAGLLAGSVPPRGSCRYACACRDGNLAFPGCQYGRTPHRMPASSRSKGLPRSISMSPRIISIIRVAAGLFKFRWVDCNSGCLFRQPFFTPPPVKPVRQKKFTSGICTGQSFGYKPPHRRSRKTAVTAARLLGNSSTVERRTLTPLILVRIQVPQPLPS